MFVDNTKKIICLSVPRTGTFTAEMFFREHLPSNSVKWMLGRHFTIPSIMRENYLSYPIAEYDIYGLCRNPIDRVIASYDLEEGLKRKVRINSPSQTVLSDEACTVEKLKTDLIDLLKIDFVDNHISKKFEEKGKNNIFVFLTKQVEWLKYQDQLINHVYKYENYNTMISDLCARYNIDFSLFDQSRKLNEQTTDLKQEDLSEEVKTKILEFYAEDKALYDSL